MDVFCLSTMSQVASYWKETIFNDLPLIVNDVVSENMKMQVAPESPQDVPQCHRMHGHCHCCRQIVPFKRATINLIAQPLHRILKTRVSIAIRMHGKMENLRMNIVL